MRRESYVREIRRLAEYYAQSPDRLDARANPGLDHGVDRARPAPGLGQRDHRRMSSSSSAKPEGRTSDLVAGLRNRKVPRTLPRHLEVNEVEHDCCWQPR